jgi:hypothetical protein
MGLSGGYLEAIFAMDIVGFKTVKKCDNSSPVT